MSTNDHRGTSNRWLATALAAATLLISLSWSATARAQDEWEATNHAAFMALGGGPVERSYGNPARTLTLNQSRHELSAGADVSTKGDFGLPLGYGYGFGPRLEVGGGMELYFHPFHAKALVSNLEAYGRYLMIEDMMAAQFTTRVLGGVGAPVAIQFEFDTPLLFKLLADRIWLYVQPNLSFQLLRQVVTLTSDTWKFGLTFAAGVSAMYLFTPAIFANLDHSFSVAFAPDALAPYKDMPVPLGFGGGYLFQSSLTAVRLNVVFRDLTEFDARGVAFMVTAVQFLGG